MQDFEKVRNITFRKTSAIYVLKQSILVFLLFSFTSLSAQEIPAFISEKIQFCEANITEVQVTQLRKELTDLENYFVSKGLLADKSGSSYREVFQKIAEENDLLFTIDKFFGTLEELGFSVYSSCFYTVLTPKEQSQFTPRLLIALEQIASDYEEVNPGAVAQRILANLTEEDFELEYFKISGLLVFYTIFSPAPTLDFGFPSLDQSELAKLLTIKLLINDNDQLVIENEVRKTESVALILYDFLAVDPVRRGIELSTARETSYAEYLKTSVLIDSVYAKLKLEMGDVPKNIIFIEPKN